jgi:hypothetical protein
MSGFANKTVEDETIAMSGWWKRNCKPFSEWFLAQTVDDRVNLLKKGCPDLPKITAKTRESNGETLTATDMLLPELTEDALMASNGRLCILFVTRRMVDGGLCIGSDIKLLQNLHNTKQLPLFSLGEQIDKMDTPFIDPTDPDENIRTLGPETTLAMRNEVLAGFESGRFCALPVWVALKVRRTAIASFIKALMQEFEEKCDEMWKPKPILEQLIQSELAMKANDAVIVEKANTSSIEELS